MRVTEANDLSKAIELALGRRFGPCAAQDAVRLSGGAMQEIWSFSCTGALSGDFILRRTPISLENKNSEETLTVTIETEAHLIEAAEKAGIPSPRLLFVLEPNDGLGRGFVMTRVEGEALGSRILRNPEFARCRRHLATECGKILASLHNIPIDSLPSLPIVRASNRLETFENYIRELGVPRPVFTLAIDWLRRNAPGAVRVQLVHGDFRLGNLLITADGVQAVLDWELSHLGDPAYDLAWLCVPSWRFGNIDLPVGGFGERIDLYNAYEQAGGDASVRTRAQYYEVFGILQWGVTCARNYMLLQNERSIERAMIARRASEAELDLLRIIDAEGAPDARQA